MKKFNKVAFIILLVVPCFQTHSSSTMQHGLIKWLAGDVIKFITNFEKKRMMNP